MILFHEMFRVGKSVETENILVAAWGRREGQGRLGADWDGLGMEGRVSFWGSENVLKLCGASYLTKYTKKTTNIYFM